jgi:O-antigen ligase
LSAAEAVLRPQGLPVAALGAAALWFAVFLGGFVFYEPAPYELFLALVIPAWLLWNPAFPRAIAPLFVLMVLFLVGGLIAATQAKHLDEQPVYYAVSGFLAVSSVFFAAVLGANPRLYRTVVNAWVAAALATVALGVAGYFGLTGELFTKFDRAAGGFEDPNVFGPFLAFPFALLVRRALTRRLGGALVSGALALVVFVGIFLSFSRAAWGLAALAAIMVAVVLFATERNAMARARYVGLAVAGIVAVAVLLAAALSIPAVSELFEQRAQLVQDYDAEHLGRFQRHAIGFNMMLERPLGIGALEFGKIYGEDEHDIWLKCLTTYGWLGFAAYLALSLWTLLAAFPLLFRTSPLQPVVQVAYIVFVGHLLIAAVIDIDHWRHVYLLTGMLWGAIAADRSAAQFRLAERRFGRSLSAGPPLRPIG